MLLACRSGRREDMGEIDVQIPEQFAGLVDEDWTRAVVSCVLEAEALSPPYDVGIVFADADTVRQLNRHYRGVDSPTDVIAFYMLRNRAADPSFPLPPHDPTHLGEVIICYPVAVEQAREQGHAVERELALLIIHGVLHLLGYDHEQTAEAMEMRRREAELLQACFNQTGASS